MPTSITPPPSQVLAASRLYRMEGLAKQAARAIERGDINAAAIAVCKMEQHLPKVLQELSL